MPGNLLAMPQDADCLVAPGAWTPSFARRSPWLRRRSICDPAAVVTDPPLPPMTVPPVPPSDLKHAPDGGGSDGPTGPSRLGVLAARLPRLAPWAVALVCVIGVILRFDTSSHLWLDESLTVEIARRPLSRLVRRAAARRVAAAVLPAPARLDQGVRHAATSRSGHCPECSRSPHFRWPGSRADGSREYAAHDPALAPRTVHRTGTAVAAAVRQLAVRDPVRQRDPDVLAGRAARARLRRWR